MSGPWRRGDSVTNGSEPGFVVADMTDQDIVLVVRWQRRGIEEIHRSNLGSIRKFTDAEAEKARIATGRTPLQSLEVLEALDRMEEARAKRSKTIRNAREQRIVDGLIRRAFAEEFECEWDKKNYTLLGTLALRPHEVGWVFKLREFVHRPIHRLFHRGP